MVGMYGSGYRRNKRYNEVCKHIAIYRPSTLCAYVSVGAELIVLPKMGCSCVWAAGITEQNEDCCVHSYPACKSTSLTQSTANLSNFPTASTKWMHVTAPDVFCYS